MRLLVEIDLSSADLTLFDAYEAAVLALIPEHGGKVEARVRTTDGRREVHPIAFPSAAAFDAFKADPRRLARSADFQRCGARSEVTEVTNWPLS